MIAEERRDPGAQDGCSSPPVRVLHVFESWRPVVSGYTTRSWELIAAQQRSRLLEPKVLVTSRQRSHGEARIDISLGPPGSIRALAPSRREELLRKVHPFYVDPRHLASAILQACVAFGADLIHSHYASTIGSTAASVASRLGVKLISEVRFDLAGAVTSETVHLPIPGFEGALRAWFERHCLRADAVVAASHSLAERLRTSFPRLARRVSVVPNGVDCATFRPRRASCDLRQSLGLEGRIVVGTTSNMLRYEGLDLFLLALQEVRSRIPAVHGLLIGDGPHREGLRAMARRMRLPVAFVDSVPAGKIPSYYGLFDLFVVPRRPVSVTRYASPVKLLEAMACALPAVASAVGDVPELLGGGRGVLVEPGSVAGLSHAIQSLAADGETREAMGRRARRWVQEHFTWDRTAELYHDIYRRALSPPC